MAQQLTDDFKRPQEHLYKGVRMKTLTPAVSLDAIREMEVRDDDIWLISYPKSGTIWSQEITSVIMECGDLDQVRSKDNLERVPFVEFGPVGSIPASYKYVDAMSRDKPRTIRTHVPYDWLPKQWHTKKPKTLYVARNPKDTAVSKWHFTNIQVFSDTQTEETFAEYFQTFCEGKVTYGSWFDHVLPYWEHRHDRNISFVKYEDMKKDLKSQMIRIADFYGRPLPADKIDECVEHCTFDEMKKNPMTNYCNAPFINHKKGVFHRNGEVGDWKNYLTVAQNEMFDSLYHGKMAGSGLTFEFEL